jgi:hypothetical protein
VIRVVCEECGGRPSILCDHDLFNLNASAAAATIRKHIGHRVSITEFPQGGGFGYSRQPLHLSVPANVWRFAPCWDTPPLELDGTWR